MNENLKNIMREVQSREKQLIRKTLIFHSPLTDELDYRVAYFIHNSEAQLWEENMKLKYNDLSIPYAIHTTIVSYEGDVKYV